MKKKHTRAWFINRVGKELIKNNNFDLFTTLIKIQSKDHAEALFLTQVKNNTYSEFTS